MDDYPTVRLKTRYRRAILVASVVVGVAGLVATGYFLPHQQPVRVVTRTVTEQVEKVVDNCPDGPFVVQTLKGWTFYHDKTTGCEYVDSYNNPDKPDQANLHLLADPNKVCKE